MDEITDMIRSADLDPHSAFEAALRVTIVQQLAQSGTLYVSTLGHLLAERGIDIRLALGRRHSGLEAAVAALASDICSVTRNPDGGGNFRGILVPPMIEELDDQDEITDMMRGADLEPQPEAPICQECRSAPCARRYGHPVQRYRTRCSGCRRANPGPA